MEGYSVTEAASVLGVPTERVWELLARGVLAGRPEGESGMRVFLQPRPASAPPSMEMPPPTPPPAREPERELSPFRELLTEFRNLTERYGQALLALGEARGEVAALRSRVDLLEARMDLRLPMGAAVAGPPIGWEASARPMFEPSLEPPLVSDAESLAETAPVIEPAVEGEPALDEELAPPEEPALEEREQWTETAQRPEQMAEQRDETEPVSSAAEEAEEADDGADRQRRRRGSHHATESFAEALARAEDPTVPELPEPHREPLGDAATDGGLPRELPAAEPIPTADDERAAAEPSAVDEPLPALVAPSFAGATVGGGVEQPAEDAGSGVGGAMLDELAEAGGAGEAPGPEPAWPSADGDSVEEPAAVDAPSEERPGYREEVGFVAELEEPQEPEASAAAVADAGAPARPAAEEPVERPTAPLVWDPERYTTAIGEPDWYADEDEVGSPSVRPEGADEGSAAAAEPPEAEAREEPQEREAPAVAPVPPTASGVATTDGSSEMEVAGSGHVVEHRSVDAGAGEAAVPDGAEDALTALDALGRSVGPEAVTPHPVAPHPSSWAPPGSDAARTSRPLDPVAEYRSGAIGSVRPTTTPATRAYRRLRRIFPG
jgi:hypothetical protein